MRVITAFVAATVLTACSAGAPRLEEVSKAQAKSPFGLIAGWKLDPSISQPELQRMRDRGYGFCIEKKSAAEKCFAQQDQSLFEFARSFALVRMFRDEPEPAFPYAVGHKLDPAAFDRVRSYCRSIYDDHGSGDARMLGPRMLVSVGGDYFGVVPVP